MNYANIPPLKIGELVARLPIIQGGMGVGISMSGLASAVSNTGGIGVISAVGLGILNLKNGDSFKETNKIKLREEIQKAKDKTDGIFGLNIMVALTDYEELIDIALDEDVDIVFLGAGLPLRFSNNLTPQKLRNAKTKFIPIVSSARAADLIFKYWNDKYNRVPDGVVVEGPKAGGHLGFKKKDLFDDGKALEVLVPEVREVLFKYEIEYRMEIPVIAAGGIYNGEDIRKFLELGADGVQMATRFVATHECDADIKFKEMYLNATKEDIVIIDSPVGLPGRAIKNKFLEDVSLGINKPFKCSWKCLKTCNFREAPYCIALALRNAQVGSLDAGFSFAGANAYKIDEIISVQELIDKLIEEYNQCEPAQNLKVGNA